MPLKLDVDRLRSDPKAGRSLFSAVTGILLVAITQPPNLSDQRDYASDLLFSEIPEKALKHSAQCAPPFGFDKEGVPPPQ